ncbi:TetR/AcrR family transcriptional regulator [Rhodococcus fascians]|nr:TetR/AcrR family transcriptional regulator [Rhodococcus fascians]MBY4114571.1 TetR/AcrR family transcriptional regulator [Rhodococcus fascians]
MASTDIARPPALQARSKETQQKILNAVLEILAKSGSESLSTAVVSEAAEVSVGSIYRRFGSKQQLLLAAQAEFLRRFIADSTRRLLTPSVDDRIRTPPQAFAHAVEAHMHTFRDHARTIRVLMLLGLQSPDIFEAGREGSHEGGRRYARFMLEHRTAIRRPDPELAVDCTFRLVYAACSHRIIQGSDLESDRALVWDELVDETAEMVCAYLLTPRWLIQD